MNPKKVITRSVQWTALSSVFGAAIYIVQISVLARYLEPSDFGLMAIAMVVIGFSQSFIDFGISSTIIYKQDITQSQLSTLYWINVFAGAIIFVIILLLAPLIASAYGHEDLKGILFWVGTTFIIRPFGQQFFVLLQKDLQFKVISVIELISKIIGLGVSLGLAINGFGVNSLVFATVIMTIVWTISFAIMGLKHYAIQFHFKILEVKEFLLFGSFQMGERTINYFSSEIDTLLIGKLLGTEALGLYSIAKQLTTRPFDIINPIVTRVTFPVMAKVQDNIERVREIYLKTINYLSSINFPIATIIFILAEEITRLFLGEKWLAAVPVIRILAVWSAIRSTSSPVGTLLMAVGKFRLAFYWNLALFFYVPLGIAIGSYFGVMGVSWSLLIVMVSLVIPNWYFLVRPSCHARFVEYHKQILHPFLISALTIIIASVVLTMVSGVVTRILVSGTVVLTIVISLNMWWNKQMINDLSRLGGR